MSNFCYWIHSSIKKNIQKRHLAAQSPTRGNLYSGRSYCSTLSPHCHFNPPVAGVLLMSPITLVRKRAGVFYANASPTMETQEGTDVTGQPIERFFGRLRAGLGSGLLFPLYFFLYF